MATTSGTDAQVERELVEGVSAERLMADTREIARGVRLSGSQAEREAFDYIEQQCRATGAVVHRYAPECLISLPGPATLTVLGDSPRTITCITHAFAGATAGTEGELIWAGSGLPADYAGLDARGKIAVTDGLASPGKMVAGAAAGVAAIINVNDAQLHEMIVTPVWGTPVPETAHLIPNLPAITVVAGDGETLKGLCGQGVKVRITAEVATGWRPIPCLSAELPGAEPGGPFVMLSGHVDSWHYGAMDNGTADATILETLRAMARRPGGLKRGLRVCFWSGHSHGRYSASTWYADACWRDLHDRCVAHVNVDSTGGVGADLLENANTMAETHALAAGAIRDVAGQELRYRRHSRNGDQSFWGVGMPSLFVTISQQRRPRDPNETGTQTKGGAMGGRGGTSWWWHTTHDTIDKIDPANLARDTKVYVLVCHRLCTAAILPLDHAASATEIRDAIKGYAEKAGDRADLSPAVQAAERLVAATADLRAAISAATSTGDTARADALNKCLHRLSQLLVPLNYTEVSPYDHDLALGAPPVPALRGANEIGALDPAGDAVRFLRTRLLRNQNRVTHTLDQATEAIRTALG